MTTGDLVALAGMAVEAAGIVLTGRGFLRTWHDFSPNEGLIGDAPLVLAVQSQARRVMGRAGDFLRRIRGYPPDVRVTHGAGAITASAAIVSAEGHAGFAPLDPALDPPNAIAELDVRTRRLSDDISAEMSRRAKVDRELSRGIDELSATVDAAVGNLDTRTAVIAVGGLRMAFAGLALVFVGLVFQGCGVLLG